jgi:hypothetical protein
LKEIKSAVTALSVRAGGAEKEIKMSVSTALKA